MHLKEAIYQRRAVRDFTEREPTRALLIELIQAAIQAPSGMDAEPWAFAVFQGRKLLEDYAYRAKAHFLTVFSPGRDPHAMRQDILADPKFNIFYNAPALVVIYAKPAGQFASVDCCLAAQNLMLAACDAGLGTCPIGFAQSWFDQADVKRELRVPVDYTAVLPIIIGYPTKKPDPVPRKSPEIIG